MEQNSVVLEYLRLLEIYKKNYVSVGTSCGE